MPSNNALSISTYKEYADEQNLRTLYELSPNAARSREWYQEQRDIIFQYAEELDLPGYVLVGIVAVLSPNAPWAKNVSGAVNLVTAWNQGRLSPKAPHGAGFYGANINKALMIYATHDVNLWISGPKVTQFYDNLMGIDHGATIDSHAIYALLGTNKRGSAHFADNVYAMAAKAYENVATEMGLTTSSLQAIVWESRRHWLKADINNATAFPNGLIAA